jgi:hypothetical protein
MHMEITYAIYESFTQDANLKQKKSMGMARSEPVCFIHASSPASSSETPTNWDAVRRLAAFMSDMAAASTPRRRLAAGKPVRKEMPAYIFIYEQYIKELATNYCISKVNNT